jgi:sugar lactone lactonase YvrE
LARLIKNQGTLNALVQQWFPQANAAARPRFVVVVDIGQGNCNAVFDADGRLLCYFDLGGGVLVNKFTFPDPTPHFCMGLDTKVILSHWDEDHNSSLYILEHQHHAKLTAVAPTASYKVLAPAQRSDAPARKKVGLKHKRSEDSKLLEGYLEGQVELSIWPDEDPNALVPPAIPHAEHGLVRVIKVSGNNINNHALALRLQAHGVNEHILLTADAEYQTGSFTHGCDNTCVGLVASHHGAELEDANEVPRPRPGSRMALAYSYGWGNSFAHPSDPGVGAYEDKGWEDDCRMDTAGAEASARFAGPRGSVGLMFSADTGPAGLVPGAAAADVDEAAIGLVATAAAEVEVCLGAPQPAEGPAVSVAAAYQAAREAGATWVADALVTPATLAPPVHPPLLGLPVALDVTAAAGPRVVAASLNDALQNAAVHAASAANADVQALADAVAQAAMRACGRVSMELTRRVEEGRKALESAAGGRVHVSTRSRDPMRSAAYFARHGGTQSEVEVSLPDGLVQRVVDAATQRDATLAPTAAQVRTALALAACEAAWAVIGVERGQCAAPPATALHVAGAIVVRDDVKTCIAAAVALAPAIPIGAFSVAPSALTDNDNARQLPRVAAVSALVANLAGTAADVAAQAAVAAARVTLAAAHGAPQVGCHRHPRTCDNGPTANSPCALSIHYATKMFAPRIRTYAGDGTAGHTGEGVAATTGRLQGPAGLALGNMGELYIADPGAHRIRRVDARGLIHTFAGDGNAAHAGDAGGNPLAAQLNGCAGLAVDEVAGVVYVADTLNHRVRSFERRSGRVSTVAGTGTAGHLGDGGPANAAQLHSPEDVFFAPELRCLFIADTGNHCIRMVDLRNGRIATVVGTPGTAGATGDGGPAVQATLNSPSGVFVDVARSIYIADRGNHCIRISEGGEIRTFAGTPGVAGHSGDATTRQERDGSATAARLNLPSHVTVDADNVVYIADTGNHCIRKVETEERRWYERDPLTNKRQKMEVDVDCIQTIAGVPGTAGHTGNGGQATLARLSSPSGVALSADGQTLYIADRGNHVVRRVNALGVITHVAGTAGTAGHQGDGGAPGHAELSSASRVVCNADGELFLCDTGNHRVRRISPDGATLHAFAGSGVQGYAGDSAGQAAAASLNGPRAVAFDATNNVLYIADTLNHCIRQVDVSTGLITTIAGTGAAGFNGDGAARTRQLRSPSGLALDTEKGVLFIADSGNHRIRKLTLATGQLQTLAGDGTAASTGNGGQASTASLHSPKSLALDYLTLTDLYVVETGTHCVRVVRLEDDQIAPVVNQPQTAGNGMNANSLQAQLQDPEGLTLDEGGNLYVADTGNHRVLKVVLASKKASVLTGTGAASSTGDGGALAPATVNQPRGLVVDTAGRSLYVAEAAGFRVRKAAM